MGIAFMICKGNCGNKCALLLNSPRGCIHNDRFIHTGGVVGSYIFKANETPSYPTGFGASFAFGASGVIAALVLEFLFDRTNKRRAAISEDEVYTKYTQEELD